MHRDRARCVPSTHTSTRQSFRHVRALAGVAQRRGAGDRGLAGPPPGVSSAPMKDRSNVITRCILALALTPTAAHASNYPPDYDICGVQETLYSGPFEVIRDFVDPWDQHYRLTVVYDGYLRDAHPDDEINLYVSLNGNDAMIEALPGVHDDAYVLLDSGPRGCHYCANGWNPPGSCDGVVFAPQESGKWLCSGPTELEQHMFFWAFDNLGQLNAWDIELAAEANGEWDSDYGNNFSVRFEPRGCW